MIASVIIAFIELAFMLAVPLMLIIEAIIKEEL